MKRGRASSTAIGYLLAVIGAVSFIGSALALLAVFTQGYAVVLNGGNAADITPYIEELVLIAVAVSIPFWLAPALPDGI